MSIRDDMTSLTRSTRTQDQPMSIPQHGFALNLSNMFRRPIERFNTSATQLHDYPLSISHRDQEQTVDRSNTEDQIEDTVDEIVELLRNEQMNHKESKLTLNEQEKSLAEFYKQEREKIAEEKLLWEENLKCAQELYSEEIFKINIGGTHKLIISKKLLCKFPDSVLAAMFSGRHKLRMHKDCVFIDRDGEMFSTMVSYLRNPKILHSLTKEQQTLFYEELDYWQIPIESGKQGLKELMEFDPLWCANTLKLENNNSLVRKHGNLTIDYRFSTWSRIL